MRCFTRLAVVIAAGLVSPPLIAATIEGRVTSQEGVRLRAAHALVWDFNANVPKQTVACDGEGRFSLTVADNVPQVLMLTGVNSEPLRFPIIAQRGERIQLEVQLRATPYFGDIIGAWLIKNFDSLSSEQLQVQLKRSQDGELMGEFEDQGSSVDVIVRSGMQQLTPPEARKYKLSPFHGYYHGVLSPTDGRVVVRLNREDFPQPAASSTAKLVRAAEPTMSLISSSLDFQNYCTRIQEGRSLATNYSMVALERYVALDGYDLDWRQRLDGESNALVREFLAHTLLYLVLSEAPSQVRRRVSDVERWLDHIPSTSTFWSELIPSCNDDKVLTRLVAAYPESAKVQNYLFRFLREHSSETLKTRVVLSTLNGLHGIDSERFARMYERITKEFPGTGFSLAALKRFREIVTPAVEVGQKVPAFAVRSLRNPEVEFSNHSMLGKVYLIDMWATWCGVCLKDMPAMHELYSRYRSDGFEILSLSLDWQAEDAIRYQSKGEYPMPWLNAWVWKGSGQERILSDLGNERGSAPQYFLVDETGTVQFKSGGLSSYELGKKLKEKFGH